MTARTDVYFNLHTGLWSMLDRQTGRVYDHARVVVSSLPVALVVQPAGQRRVVQERSKNVHAFVRGSYLEPSDEGDRWRSEALSGGLVLVSYNPYRGPSFYRKDTGEDIKSAESVIMLAPVGAPPQVWAHL
jgi:hypothetical protein